jgi:hypothetical protein
LSSAGCVIEVMDCSLNLTGDALPVELRIEINEVGWRGVT